MNRFKKFFVAGLCACVLPCVGLMAGCDKDDPVGISSIEKTGTEGLVDTYTIYYTDGTTSTFTVTNGEDGVGSNGHTPVITISPDGYWVIDGIKSEVYAKGENVTITDVYNKYVQENGPISYNDFLKLYLSFNMGDNSNTIAQCLRSVLKVYSEHCITTSVYPGFDPEKNISRAGGSAVIYKMDQDYTYIVTNYHVVYNSQANTDNIKYNGNQYIAKSVHGYLYGSEGGPSYDGKTLDANGYPIYDYGANALSLEYIGGALDKDIAVLRVPTSDVIAINPDACAVTLAEDYHVGDTAIAIGNPEDEGISVTEGIVSVDGEVIQLDIDNNGTIENYTSIRIDTSIYHGSSGGGLFNADGELFAITNAGEDASEHINYAIPLPIVQTTVDNILYYHKQTGGVVHAKRLVVGINGVNILNSKYVYDDASGTGKIVETISPIEIVADSISDKVGLMAGDIIHSIYINDVEYKLDRYYEIADVMMTVRAGNIIKFKYTRGANLPVDSSSYIVLENDLVEMA